MEPLDEFEAAEQAAAIERGRKRVLRARIMALLALVLTVTTCAYLYYTDMYQGTALDPHPCPPEEVEALVTDRWQRETLPVAGDRLVGLVRPPRREQAPWVLYFGGNVEHFLRSARAYSELLLEKGDDFGWASFAYRGFDTSTGESTPGTFQSDARAVLDHLGTAHQVAPDRLHVIGFSLGANAAALLSEDLSRTGEKLASTTLLSPGMAPHSLPAWLFPLVMGAWEMPSKLAVMAGPVLLVSAKDDKAYPPAIHARKMPVLLGERLTRHLEVDGGHDAPLRDGKALIAVRDFVRGTAEKPD